MYVGSFAEDLNQFPLDVQAAVEQFKASGITNLLVDVTNNGGLCTFSGQMLAKSDAGGPQVDTST